MENSDAIFDDLDENTNFPSSLTSFPSIFDMMPSPSENVEAPTFDFSNLLNVPDYGGPYLFDCTQNTVANSTSLVDSGVVSMDISATPNSFLSPNEIVAATDKTTENGAKDDTNAGNGENLNQYMNNNGNPISSTSEKKNSKTETEPKFVFLTKTEEDCLDDGYKWRKYGQKNLRKSPHPRSYYRCINDGCKVKKYVERYSEDPSMVMTTYEGRHTHLCPPTSRHLYTSGSITKSTLTSQYSLLQKLKQKPSQNQIWDKNVDFEAAATMSLNSNSSSCAPSIVNSTTCVDYANTSSSNSFLQNPEEQSGFKSLSSVVAPEDNLSMDNNGLLEDILAMHMRNRKKGNHV